MTTFNASFSDVLVVRENEVGQLPSTEDVLTVSESFIHYKPNFFDSITIVETLSTNRKVGAFGDSVTFIESFYNNHFIPFRLYDVLHISEIWNHNNPPRCRVNVDTLSVTDRFVNGFSGRRNLVDALTVRSIFYANFVDRRFFYAPEIL